MRPREIRHLVTRALLQVETPLTLPQLAEASGLTQKRVTSALDALKKEHLVVTGRLIPGNSQIQYRWAARWQAEVGERAVSAKDEAKAAVAAAGKVPDHKLWLDSAPAIAFHKYIVGQYTPPREKRFLVFLQCSVRRPFSKSPSHGSMRRAISVATGCDPANEFQKCPVHVVVLASKIGPVPYELEDVYPANVRGGGVKDFDDGMYQSARPVLARRMAAYIKTHGGHYDAMWTFTEGRYGDVMTEAARLAKVDLEVLPSRSGERVLCMGDSVPRTYWQKFWIQLYLRIVAQLDPDEQKKAAARLKKLKVEYD